MKIRVDAYNAKNPLIILVSETLEEKELLMNLWLCGVASREMRRKEHGNIEMVLAPGDACPEQRRGEVKP